MYRFIFIIFSLLCFVSCGNKSEKKTDKHKKENPELYSLASPRNGATFKSGENFVLEIKPVTDTIKMDSCILNIDGKYFSAYNSLPQDFNVNAIKMGIRRFSIQVYSNNAIISTVPFALKIIPSSAPVGYTYRIVKEYPHDDKAYTQGLFYNNGYLYEGTGLEGKSSLRKVELNTGKILNIHSLDNKYFGEGICLFNNKIYQLTWKNKEGFIYNYDDFSPIGKFNYNTEGWGITNDATNLWMSDGTSYIYKLNPDNMNIIDQIEVYSNTGPQKYINELEYINGEIWANVYGENYIVRIDPRTGEIKGKIDLTNILRKDLIKPDTDVLNGIAYDADKNRIFVTGKNWPRLFEIEVIKR